MAATDEDKQQRAMRMFARHMMVKRHGPSGAAWLVMKFRRRLATCGAFDLRLPPNQEQLLWVELALECFRTRRGWRVSERVLSDGSRVWRVHHEPHKVPRGTLAAS